MSRVAKKLITIPSGIEVKLEDHFIIVKNNKHSLKKKMSPLVEIILEKDVLKFAPIDSSLEANKIAGTTRAIVNNMVQGIHQAFEARLELVGVGYRAQMQDNILNLTLGFSHPVQYLIPEGVTVQVPSQTEIILQSIDKELLGQTVAQIRKIRKPDAYKGKGIRKKGQLISLKEVKKK